MYGGYAKRQENSRRCYVPQEGKYTASVLKRGTVTIFHIILYLIRMRMKGANTYERNSCKQTRSQKQDVCWRTDQHWSDDSDSDCHVLYTFLVCVPTRALMGWLTGVLFQLIHKVDRTNTFSYFAGGFLAAFLNTLFFMGTLVLLFWNTDYIQGLNQTFGNVNPLVFVVLFVGVNGALEMPASCVAGGIVSKALSKAVHKKRA